MPDLPVYLTVERWCEYFWSRPVTLEEAGDCTVARWPYQWSRPGLESVVQGALTEEVMIAVLDNHQAMAEFPDSELGRDAWRLLFLKVGYSVDGRTADRPSEPLTLWRGSVPERRADWSWTADREIAASYAAGSFTGQSAAFRSQL